jgi:hypothetical protein
VKRIPLDRLLVAVLCCLVWAPAHARQPDHAQGGWVIAARGETWEELSPQEQRLLREYRGSWQRHSADERARLQRGAQRYLELSPRERDQVQRERERYQRLEPHERNQLREKYKASKKDKASKKRKER